MPTTSRGKGDSGSALRRQWLELKFLAQARTSRTVTDVLAHLSGEGLSASRRTIERDLAQLSEHFPLKHDGHSPAGWSFERGAPRVLIPGLSAHEALSFLLVERHLGALLPGTTRAHLAAHFSTARQVLASSDDGKKVARWPECVVAVPGARPTLPARVPDRIRDAVYDALLRGRRLRAGYRARDGKLRALLLHPLGLALRETVTYLVAVADGHEQPRTFALHRIKSAEVVELPATGPAGFDLRRYVEQELEWRFSSEELRLELRVSPEVVLNFEEMPLSGDQTIEEDERGWFVVRASVPDTRTLRSFLLGYGGQVAVEAPPALREAICAEARRALEAHRGDGPAGTRSSPSSGRARAGAPSSGG